MSDDRLRQLIDSGLLERRVGDGRKRVMLALSLVFAALAVTATDPRRWWIFVMPLCVLPFLRGRKRDDMLVRQAVLEWPAEISEITHHRGEPTLPFGAGGLAVSGASAMRRHATRDQFHVWIQLVSGAHAAIVLDEDLGTELVALLAERCPHVAVRHGLPSGVSGLVVE